MILKHPPSESCPDSGKDMYYDPPVHIFEGSKPEDFLPLVCGGCSEEWSQA